MGSLFNKIKKFLPKKIKPKACDAKTAAAASFSEVAKKIRGSHKPALIIYGVHNRSGSNYLAHLLKLHPHVYYAPRAWYQPNLLPTIAQQAALQDFFVKSSKFGAKAEEFDFPLFWGASLIAYLYDGVPEPRQILLKATKTRNLNFFSRAFPYEKIILLLRDGRDVAASAMASWPEAKMESICQEWAENALEILEFDKQAGDSAKGRLIVKYEDVCLDPAGWAKHIFEHFAIDSSLFPEDQAEQVAVYGSSELKENGEVHWRPVPKPEGFNPIGRWKMWKDKEKNIFKSIAGEMLIRCGYENNMDW